MASRALSSISASSLLSFAGNSIEQKWSSEMSSFGKIIPMLETLINQRKMSAEVEPSGGFWEAQIVGKL